MELNFEPDPLEPAASECIPPVPAPTVDGGFVAMLLDAEAGEEVVSALPAPPVPVDDEEDVEDEEDDVADVVDAPVVEPVQHVPRVGHARPHAGLRWTPEEDAVLARAVRENRKAPDKRSLNGIMWAVIARRAPTDYPELLRHLTAAEGSKTCSKRWCQFLCPDDQVNKNRKWR